MPSSSSPNTSVSFTALSSDRAYVLSTFLSYCKFKCYRHTKLAFSLRGGAVSKCNKEEVGRKMDELERTLIAKGVSSAALVYVSQTTKRMGEGIDNEC